MSTPPTAEKTVMQEQENYCPRHPSTQTNLRCGRCGQLICPRCMVTSPVGARCPDCARIGRPKVMEAGAGDLSRAVVAALGVGLVGGIAVALIVRLLAEITALGIFGYLITAVILMGTGVPVGETIRRAAKRSMDIRIRYLAAFTVFMIYAVAIFIYGPIFGYSPQPFLQLYGLIGLGLGIWTAMNRVRP